MELEGNAVELNLCYDPSILWSGSGVIQDTRAVVQILGLHIDSPSVTKGRTETSLAMVVMVAGKEHTANGSGRMCSRDVSERASHRSKDFYQEGD